MRTFTLSPTLYSSITLALLRSTCIFTPLISTILKFSFCMLLCFVDDEIKRLGSPEKRLFLYREQVLRYSMQTRAFHRVASKRHLRVPVYPCQTNNYRTSLLAYNPGQWLLFRQIHPLLVDIPFSCYSLFRIEERL